MYTHINKNEICIGKPKTKLLTCLKSTRKNMLRAIAYNHKMSFHYITKKEILVEMIDKKLKELDYIRTILLSFDDDEILNLTNNLYKFRLKRGIDYSSYNKKLIEYGMMYYYEVDDEILGVFPKEYIKLCYDIIAKRANKTPKILQYSKLMLIIKASNNLYGVIYLNKIYEIYKKYFFGKSGFLVYVEFIDFINEMSKVLGYTIIDNSYIVNDKILHDSNLYEAENIIVKNTPYYIPEYDEFIKYANCYYIKKNEAYLKMYNFLKICKFTDSAIDEMFLDIEESRKSKDKKMLYDIITSIPNEKDDNNITREFMRLHDEFINSRKIWHYHGYSFDEMIEIRNKEVSKNENITEYNKTGRNTLCPCGSGKKYKKCCLNKNNFIVKRVNKASIDQMKELYELVDEFDKLKPWNDLYDIDIISFKSKILNEIVYCSIYGKTSNSKGFNLYIGTEGLKDLLRQDNMEQFNLSPQYAISEANTIYFLMLEKEIILDDNIKILKELGRKINKSNYVFEKKAKSYYVSIINEAEANIMLESLKTFFVAYKAYKENQKEILFDEIGAMRYIRREENRYTIIYEHFSNMPLNYDTYHISDKTLLNKIKYLEYSNDSWQLDVEYLGHVIFNQANEKSLFPKVVIVSNEEKNIIMNTEILEPDDVVNVGYAINKFLIELCEKSKVPTKLYIKNLLLVDLISEVCELLDIEIVKVETLEFINEALEEFAK